MAKNSHILILWLRPGFDEEIVGAEIKNISLQKNPNLKIFKGVLSEISKDEIFKVFENLESPDEMLAQAMEVWQELDLRVYQAFTRLQTTLIQKHFTNLPFKTLRF